MKIKYGISSDIGRRETNEDSANVFEQVLSNGETATLAVVCDGLGGHAYGEIASSFTVTALGTYFKRTDFMKLDSVDVRHWLYKVFQYIQKDFERFAKEEPDTKDMGTTAVGFIYTPSVSYIFNIGDSRAYIDDLSKNVVLQITTDQNVLSTLTKEQKTNLRATSYTNSQLFALLSTLGPTKNYYLDLFKLDIPKKCYLLLTSDGIHNYMPTRKLKQVIENPNKDLKQKIDLMILQSKLSGSTDNLTGILIEIDN